MGSSNTFIAFITDPSRHVLSRYTCDVNTGKGCKWKIEKRRFETEIATNKGKKRQNALI